MPVYRSFVVAVFLLMAVSAMAGTPMEWSDLDHALDRIHLLNAYTARIIQPDDPVGDYRDHVRYVAAVDSIGPDSWHQLASAQQRQREELAKPFRDRVESARRTLADIYNASVDPSLRHSGPGLFAEGTTLFPETLGALVNITGLLPVDAMAWFDQAYLAGCIGDTRRQEAALLIFHDLYRDGTSDDRERWVDRRIRSSLDLGWLARDRGRFDAAVAWALDADAIMDALGGATPAATREGRLLAAIARAEQEEFHEARSLAAPLDDLPFRRRNRQAFQDQMNASNGTQIQMMMHQGFPRRMIYQPDYSPSPAQKNAWTGGANPWARHWVHALIAVLEDNEARALKALGQPDPLIEYPAHLNYRFWNDRGRVYEHFGHHDLARRCYALAIVHRPFFVYYPLEGRRGRSRLYADPVADQVYFTGAGLFYLAGDRFAHAAGCLLAYEFTTDPAERAILQELAEEGLTACRLRGIHPTAALAQRGRLRFLAGDLVHAETDLTTACEEMQAKGDVDPDLVLILGLTHFNGGDYTGAASWLERFCKLRPDAAIGWRTLGLAAAHAGFLPAAESAFDRSVDLEPNDPTAWFNRALVKVKRADREGALIDLGMAQALLPDHPDIARGTEAISQGPLPDLNLNATPIVFEADAQAKAMALITLRQRVSLMGEMGADDWRAEALADTASLSALEDAFLRDPGPANRTRLAARHHVEGRPEEVRRLLAPTWDTGADLTTTMLLLSADRAVGDARRARALVHGLKSGGSTSERPELWRLVGAICLEDGQSELGAVALGRAEELTAEH